MFRTITPSILFITLLASIVKCDSVSTQSTAYSAGTYGAGPYQTFQSSSLKPPRVNILTPATSQASTNLTMLSYRGSQVTQPANVILDNDGHLVWSSEELGYGNSMDLIVQSYNGEDVLTFFTGSFYATGYGVGAWIMLNQSYDVVGVVTTLNTSGVTNSSDFHEMVITSEGTALVEAWVLTNTDLSVVDGPSSGYTYDCIFQEVTIDGNNSSIIFNWSALDHISIDETYFEIADGAGDNSSDPFDWCHINSLEKDTAGNYLISLRGPSTLYSISGTTGEILWRLGGKNTNFTMGDDTSFWYQHDARLMSPITTSPFNLSLFDNAIGGGDPVEATARGLVLSVDTSAMTVTFVEEYIPSFNSTAASQGSMTAASNGNRFVGWGAEPYYTEYLEDGTIIHDVQFGSDASTSVESYRAFKQAWTGYPTTSPAFVLNGTTGYVSWNGATEVATWSLMGGNSTTALKSVSNVTKSGFETSLPITGSHAYYSAVALSSTGATLGTSKVVQVSNIISSSSSTSSTSESASTSSATEVFAVGNTVASLLVVALAVTLAL